MSTLSILRIRAYASEAYASAEHTRKELMRLLVPYAYAEHKRKIS